MEKPYRLIVKRPGSLESVVIDREITPEQLAAIEAAVEGTDEGPPSNFAVEEFWDALYRSAPKVDLAEMPGGIEQFQAEDR